MGISVKAGHLPQRVAAAAIILDSGIGKLSAEQTLTHALGDGGYQILGVICFAIMGGVLFKVARRPQA